MQHQHRRVLWALPRCGSASPTRRMCPTAHTRSPGTATPPTSSRAPATIFIVSSFSCCKIDRRKYRHVTCDVEAGLSISKLDHG
jgi:hypothetical protein